MLGDAYRLGGNTHGLYVRGTIADFVLYALEVVIISKSWGCAMSVVV